ncbi:MAG: hypothetical protein ACLPX9_16600 [Rhodomicrobium sp.]
MSITSHFDDLPSVSPLQAASRFDPYFDVYGLCLKQQADLDNRTVTLIARSPASPPAQALAMNLGRFQPMSLEVRVIFTQIAPAGAFNFVVQALGACCRQAPEAIIRWAKNRALLDAHERLTLGRSLCWTGDSMRRSEDSRSAMDRVDEGTPPVVAEANASFEALWGISNSLPKTVFSRGASQCQIPALQEQALLQALSAEPNVISLDAHLRLRRH